jgi:CobQ-like glutamine amidotransferase family enzyme
LPATNDLYFFGGGQDASQAHIAEDLHSKAAQLKQDVENGVPLLAVCGGYQLLGTEYLPFSMDPVPGIGIFPVKTVASNDRMIGNLTITASTSLGLLEPTIVGFENHSGKTTLLNSSAVPLGTVTKGFGNNGSDKTEGCILNNAIGCYLHGSLLPKNPHLADWLIGKALHRTNPESVITPLADTLEWLAHNQAVGR